MTALEIQIKRIIENLQPDEAAKEILRLFSVVVQSEQLACGNPTHTTDMIEKGHCTWCTSDIYRKIAN